MDDNSRSGNFGSVYARLNNLENEMKTARERIHKHADALLLLADIPHEFSKMEDEMVELRSMHRDLHQKLESWERINEAHMKHLEERSREAGEQRDRIEHKMDEMKTAAFRMQLRVLLGLLGIMLSIIAFLIVPFFRVN